MAVANHIVNIIAIYLGHMDMDATFSNEKEYTTGTGSTQYMVAIGDFNNDDLLNIAVANSGTNNVGIFLGFGNGSFKTQIELSTGSARSIAISLADFNKDTSLDIATVDYGTHSISIFYGYGTDYFSTPSRYSTGYDSFPSALAIGDFNSDHYLDLAISNYGTNNIGIFLSNKNRTCTNQIMF
ncbi:unnamed protein product [Rotaria magnacalcarata]|uniref:VCBS repeat-containing protein n=1 Tax=Rotaria magnacalcarata TaxID=392030 RepID=A0A8S3IFE8_9BILA|nr:unnamed protein product [Rotaria magnacalcarata]